MSASTVEALASIIQGKIIGDGKISISGITNLETPGPGLITFIQDAKNLKNLEASSISCLIVPPQIHSSTKTLIQVQNPKLAWAMLLQHFHPEPSFPAVISEKAVIAKTAQLGKGVTVEDFAVISEGVRVGDQTVIRAHVYLDRNACVGSHTLLHPHVVIYRDCRIGNYVIIHAGSVIGADGFGYVATPQAQEKIPQVGNVIIEDGVEIGSLVTVDRATIGSTLIGKGTKIDNQVQIGHNVQIGAHTVISAQTGISGSSKIGSHVTMGGKVGLGDHVEIGDWTMVGAGAGFPSGKKIPGKQIVFGQPARPYEEARKQIAAQLRAAEMLEDLRALKKKVAELEQRLKD